MEDKLFSKQSKKLLMVGFFLWCVAMLVGGEDDPGMIAQMNDGQNPQGSMVGSIDDSVPTPTPQTVSAPAPARPDSSALAAWYAESGSLEPAEPEAADPAPVDESHLINDTAPLVDVTPIMPPPDAVAIVN